MTSTNRQLPLSISCSSFSLLRNLLFRFVRFYYVSKYQISDKNDSHNTESHSIISINIWTAAVSRPNLTTRGFREIQTHLFKYWNSGVAWVCIFPPIYLLLFEWISKSAYLCNWYRNWKANWSIITLKAW